MGYVLRVRFSSFFAGAAAASAMGLYLLRDDYKAAHRSISQQVSNKFIGPVGYMGRYAFSSSRSPKQLKMKGIYESLDGRVSVLEKLKEAEATKQVDAAE